LATELDETKTLEAKVATMMEDFTRLTNTVHPDTIKLKALQTQYDEYEKSMMEQVGYKTDMLMRASRDYNESNYQLTFSQRKPR
jgi:hypothetical protein